MRKLMSAGLAGSVALTVGSCSSHADKDAVITLPPEPASTTEAPATAEPFAAGTAPLVPQVAAPEYMPGLLQSTNSVEQTRQVRRSIQRQSRTDPFASLPPKLQQPRPVAARPDVPLLRQLPTRARRMPRLIQRRPTLANKPKFSPYIGFPTPPTVTVPPLTQPRTRLTALKPKRTTPLPPKQSTPLLSALPPLPVASLANAVEVSGVVVVGSVAHAIVKAPNEASSRHLQVGQRFSNGQVLIKRIEVKTGFDPIIILEENGIEVAKAIGEAIQDPNPA
ncbi:hypothetical protein H6F86_12370 [Phormidium sp. FACHB-592]|uniref:Uncharacterized protein n=1 Tax=Stenomitos frigidus AS-A4 TaxID=2933935 RepID=A0ABV0KJF0_9CYAN|nr:hypothetical protein [Phormidium sp. FACHB-592]MBD2074668.1 hypothetical protein [Phormidium sp. FACHB-592]